MRDASVYAGQLGEVQRVRARKMAEALAPVDRLSSAQLEAACAALRAIPREPFVPRNPYRLLNAGAVPVDFYEPSYVASAGTPGDRRPSRSGSLPAVSNGERRDR
jgi:hypothetical protein